MYTVLLMPLEGQRGGLGHEVLEQWKDPSPLAAVVWSTLASGRNGGVDKASVAARSERSAR